MKVLRKMKNTVVSDPLFALFPLYFYIVFVSKQLHRKALTLTIKSRNASDEK